MRYAVDSSSVINLINAGALGLVCGLERSELWLPPLVVDECGPSGAAAILEVCGQGSLHLVNDDTVPADLFLGLLNAHGLGDGETECIALALLDDELGVCCDDGKARSTARALIAPDRVIGTIRLLRWCVEEALIDCGQAFDLFRRMKAAGGFLPDTEQAFFCADSQG